MALDVSVILPNNLKSGYLQSEFIASGLAYTSNRYSPDPSLNNNKNQLVLGFELRDKETRDLAYLKRIKTLYISNDPFFESSATVFINDWPEKSTEFNSTFDYNYNLNSNYFFDNTLSQGSFGSTEAGTGLFKIHNWPLSANGGLSRVYIKAIIEGPGNQEVEYPNGYGIYDTIFWEGEIPTTPSNTEFSTIKNGWIGKNTKVIFDHSSSFSQGNSDGIASYLLSKYEISGSGTTPNVYSSRAANTYRTILPNSSIANTGYNSYKFYRESGVSNYSSSSLNLDQNIILGSSSFDKGVFFYSKSKVLNTQEQPDFIAQAAFAYTTGSIGSTSSIFLKLFDQPDFTSNSKEIAIRIDLPNSSYPTSTLYTIENNVESVNKQITTLQNSIAPLIQQGGIIEIAYSGMGTAHALIESYFTPFLDQNSISGKSYLLANSIISSFGTTFIGCAFGYQINSYASETNTIKLQEMVIANSKNNLGLDLGDCSNNNLNSIFTPITKLTNNWTTEQNSEYVILYDKLSSLSLVNSVNSTYIEVNKIDVNSEYNVPSIYEIQLLKPSLNKSLSFEVKYLHKSDDFYVAFSPVSSYRPHVVNGFKLEWDRVIGSRCIEDFAYSNNPVNAPTILVKFSKNQNNIVVLQRNTDNTFSKQTLKTYSPSNTFDRYVIEISDQQPSEIKGMSNSNVANATWIYIKKSNGINLELVGFAQIKNKMPTSDKGLGYYAACGFIESPYNETGGSNYNKIYEVIFSPLFTPLNDLKNIKSANLSLESLGNNPVYMGQKLLSANTDFESFSYNNPISNSAVVEISAASTGSNIDISNLATQIIDDVDMNTLENNSFILLKDQIDESENGIYKKIVSGQFEIQTTAFDVPYKVISGTVNKYSTFYKIRTNVGNLLNDRFVSTSYFSQLNIDEISTFISNINPSLFEFKLNYLDYENPIDLDSINIRFYENSNDLPDSNNPLTDWLSIERIPLHDSYTIQPNSNLIQLKLKDSQKTNFNVSKNDKIWVQIALPFNTSLAKSNGPTYIDNYILNGKFTNHKLAQNLWHKLFCFDTLKSENLNHKAYQFLRVRSLSHGKLSSQLTNIIGPSRVDIFGPSYLGNKPLIENISDTTLRNIELNIFADDDDSGIMSFRIGREIDNFRIQYTPWMSWSQFTLDNNGLYTIYLYGNLNYYNSGIANTSFDLQNMNFSGSRKIWAQLLDYSGNVSESYPLTFVTQSWNLIDTQAPIAKLEFYNPKLNQITKLTNLVEPLLKLNADDIVSGVKDFKYRKISNSGPENWSEWEFMNNYKKLNFTGENDGVKKVEFVFRDYGNNITQPENKWEVVERPKK